MLRAKFELVRRGCGDIERLGREARRVFGFESFTIS